MAISIIFNIDDDIIYIYNNNDIKLLDNNLIGISLKACHGNCQSKKHHLLLEVVISSPERRLLFVHFTNSHSIVYISKIELAKLFSPI